MRTLLLALGFWALLPACQSEPSKEGSDAPPPAPYECVPGPVARRDYTPVADDTFPVGPILMHSDQQGATIVWETDEICSGVVRFGPHGSALSSIADSKKVAPIHVAHLSGLAPDTRYDYEVESCGAKTGVLSFYTAPPLGAPVRFAVIGDNRSSPVPAQQVVHAMATSRPHFVVNTGDVVGNGWDPLGWREQFFEPARELGHFVSTFIAIGNHESNALNFYEYTAYPYEDAVSDHEAFGSNYALSYGNVFLLFVDTNSINFHLSLVEETALGAWIRAQLHSEAARSATWRIAVGHHPAFTESWTPGSCDSYMGTGSVALWLLPALAAADFRLYFAGHTHAYERGESQGVVQIIAGGGGAALDEICRDLLETEVASPMYHYVDVEAGCEELTMRVMSVPGGETPFEVIRIAK